MALASRARVRNHGDMQPDSPKGPVERALMVLEVVAERGGASAKEIAHSLDLPLPVSASSTTTGPRLLSAIAACMGRGAGTPKDWAKSA